MPRDIIYYLARFFLTGQTVDETGNDEKMGEMVKLLRRMGQDVMLRPIEKENVILKLVEKL
jgi:hypothetical protein